MTQHSYQMHKDDFLDLMDDFSDLVADHEFVKMDYPSWRRLKNFSGPLEITWVYPNDIYPPEIMIREVYGSSKDEVVVYGNDDSFGEFLYDNLLANVESMKKCNTWETYEKSLTADQYNSCIKATDRSANDIAGYVVSYDMDSCPGAYLSYDGTVMDKLDRKADTIYVEDLDKRVNDLYDAATAATPMKPTHIFNKEKEKTAMKFNFDFGPVNPSTVRMSMYGLAVKNKAGTWVSYDANSGNIVDVDVFNFDGAKFLYKMPVAIKDITAGDVVIHNGAPMFVLATGTKTLTVVDVISGERKDIMLATSPFGFNFATKVVNFLGNMMTGATVENPFGNMWMLMAMSGDAKMDDMLPLALMANGNMDMSNPMLMWALAGNRTNDPMMLMAMMGAFNKPATSAHTCTCGGTCHHADGAKE